MNDLDILNENLIYNECWVLHNAYAIKSAIDDFVNKKNTYLQTDYINEKFKLCKQYQKRVFQIEKEIKKLSTNLK